MLCKAWTPVFVLQMLLCFVLQHKGIIPLCLHACTDIACQGCHLGLMMAIAVQRSILFDLKDEIVPPTNETVAQVFARLSAYRDAMDGPQVELL